MNILNKHTFQTFAQSLNAKTRYFLTTWIWLLSTFTHNMDKTHCFNFWIAFDGDGQPFFNFSFLASCRSEIFCCFRLVRERADFYDLKDARNKPLLAEEHAFQELMRRKHFVDCRKKRHHAFQAPGTVLKPDLAWREYLESTNILYLSIHSWCWRTLCSQFSMLDLGNCTVQPVLCITMY